MKKLLIAALFAMVVLDGSAQTTQGRKSLSASAAFSTENSKNERTITQFTLTPSVGYFIKDGLEAGVSLDYTYYKFEADNDFPYAERRRQIAFGPYLRKYIPIVDKLYLHGTAGVEIGFGNASVKLPHETSYNKTSTSTSYEAYLSSGLTYFATGKIAFTAHLGSIFYSKTDSKSTTDDSFSNSSDFGINLSPSSLSIGVSYFFGQ